MVDEYDLLQGVALVLVFNTLRWYREYVFSSIYAGRRRSNLFYH
jgi:hypothetical protein